MVSQKVCVANGKTEQNIWIVSHMPLFNKKKSQQALEDKLWERLGSHLFECWAYQIRA